MEQINLGSDDGEAMNVDGNSAESEEQESFFNLEKDVPAILQMESKFGRQAEQESFW